MRRKAAAAFAAAVLAAVLACMLCGCASEYAEQDLPEKAGYVRTQDIHIRDVGILAHEGKYYMYGMYPCSVEDGGLLCERGLAILARTLRRIFEGLVS